jgi:hypothetical protein
MDTLAKEWLAYREKAQRQASLTKLYSGEAIIHRYGAKTQHFSDRQGITIEVPTSELLSITEEDSQLLRQLGWKIDDDDWIFYLEGDPDGRMEP